MNHRQTRTAGVTSSTIPFGRGLAPMVLFLIGTSVLATLFPLYVYPSLEGPVTLIAMALAFAAIAAIAWVALRSEGVTAEAVGLGRADVLPGVAAVAGLYLLVNAIAAVSAFASSGTVGLTVPGDVSASTWVAVALVQLLFVGITEEFAFRAYVQNKLVALFGGGRDRVRKAVAILVGVLLFALWHIPQRVFGQGLTAPNEVFGTLVVVVVFGILLGLLYEYTRNVVLVGLLHGTLNWSFLFVADVSMEVSFLVALPVFAVGLWYYRRWARDDRLPGFGQQVQARVVR
jgi:membrane protease YdiL (CAAX protease family)